MNKIDTVEKEQRDEINKKFKEFIIKEVKNIRNDINFILNDENEIKINGKDLNDRISKFDTFEKYLNYCIQNSFEIDEKPYNFYKYLVGIMNKDFNLSLKEETDEEDSDEEDVTCPDFMEEKDFEEFQSLIKCLKDNNLENKIILEMKINLEKNENKKFKKLLNLKTLKKIII